MPKVLYHLLPFLFLITDGRKREETVLNTVSCRPLKIYAGKCFDIYKAHLITTGGVG